VSLRTPSVSLEHRPDPPIVPEQKRGGDDSDQVYTDVDRRPGASFDEALVILVGDRVEDGDRHRDR
jgi:hypothetical protein